MQSITAIELQALLSRGEDVQLIDVREPMEHELYNIGGELIPLGQLMEHADELSSDKPVIVYCEKGIRSVIAIQRLQQKYPMLNLFNLSGGMYAWRNTVGANPES